MVNIITDSEPECRLNLPTNVATVKVSDQVSMSCDVQYYGNIPPVVRWSLEEDDQKNTNNLELDKYIRSTSILKVSASKFKDSKTYSCTINFKPDTSAAKSPLNNDVSANNDVVFTCKSQFGPIDVIEEPAENPIEGEISHSQVPMCKFLFNGL